MEKINHMFLASFLEEVSLGRSVRKYYMCATLKEAKDMVKYQEGFRIYQLISEKVSTRKRRNWNV